MRQKEYCGCLWLFKSNGLFILPQVLIKTELYPGNGKKQEPKESICGLTSLPGPGTAKLNTPRSLNRKMLVPLIFTGI